MDGLKRLADANPIPVHTVAGLAALLPAPPVPAQPPRERLAARRTLMLVAIGAAVLAAGPALAFRAQLAQTIHDFLAGDAPPQAKTVIQRIAAQRAGPDTPKLDGVTLVVTTSGPQGDLQLYRLNYANGEVGHTIVDTSHTPPQFRGGVALGPRRPLKAGQALDIRGSGVEYPGRTPVYFDGIVSSQVATVDVVYANQDAHNVAVANGYMLGWVSPADGHYGDGKLIARDAQMNEIGRFDFCETHQNYTDVEFRIHTSTMPADPTAACAIAPTPDGGINAPHSAGTVRSP